MPRKRLSLDTRLILPLALVVLAAGCGPVDPRANSVEAVESAVNPAGWQQIPLPVENQVETVTVSHKVAFAGNQSEVTNAERVRLRSFLESAGVPKGTRLGVEMPSTPLGDRDALSVARASAIRLELYRLGYGVKFEDPEEYAARGDDLIEVRAARTIVALPDCSQPQPLQGQRPLHEFGCSRTAILGLMVANPSELIEGQTLAPADGEASVLGVQRYRAGTPAALLDETTTE